MNTKTPFKIAAAALMLAAATAAIAAEAPQVRVGYADLDLDTPAGAAALYRRIHAAAAEVCPAADRRELALIAPIDACIDRAVANAVAAVNRGTLTELYGKTEKAPAVRLAAMGR